MDNNDALGVYTVWIDLDGLQGTFQECSPIKIENEMIETKEVINKKLVVNYIPGPPKRHGEITLKRGARKEDDWWRWFDAVHKENVSGARKTGSMVIEDFSSGEVKRYNIEGALPKSFSTSAFKAGGSEVATEELVLTYNYITKK